MLQDIRAAKGSMYILIEMGPHKAHLSEVRRLDHLPQTYPWTRHPCPTRKTFRSSSFPPITFRYFSDICESWAWYSDLGLLQKSFSFHPWVPVPQLTVTPLLQ
ncbi:hypothetical protein SERLA73DRAFT_175867 [Serpula lacrymans var. lacrymans S7.3]|uniref:Uncharacterized protein n=2 Tax=Serpula lacrymans var. lacrymans TaxID=341189 RepID=F8PJH0_SERL3|nr:uncharacterized protein SERLADRAFT_458500 [Serpula lacrymans var. lacrymans S7.9]EGO04108.1 hypothetical protein SERLA73DRAFT_175867 [Serpula lacrymans var. lacrymans S7.3]EGO30035.1 hypothetical protein SERLADRAFT_458500 [Serpula lacrymans var. lacrymans S7.9]